MHDTGWRVDPVNPTSTTARLVDSAGKPLNATYSERHYDGAGRLVASLDQVTAAGSPEAGAPQTTYHRYNTAGQLQWSWLIGRESWATTSGRRQSVFTDYRDTAPPVLTGSSPTDITRWTIAATEWATSASALSRELATSAPGIHANLGGNVSSNISNLPVGANSADPTTPQTHRQGYSSSGALLGMTTRTTNGGGIGADALRVSQGFGSLANSGDNVEITRNQHQWRNGALLLTRVATQRVAASLQNNYSSETDTTGQTPATITLLQGDARTQGSPQKTEKNVR